MKNNPIEKIKKKKEAFFLLLLLLLFMKQDVCVQ
jgi:hypothetical protein